MFGPQLSWAREAVAAGRVESRRAGELVAAVAERLRGRGVPTPLPS